MRLTVQITFCKRSFSGGKVKLRAFLFFILRGELAQRSSFSASSIVAVQRKVQPYFSLI